MSIIATTQIKGIAPVVLGFENKAYVVRYDEFEETFDTLNDAFDEYFKQVQNAYDDYR